MLHFTCELPCGINYWSWLFLDENEVICNLVDTAKLPPKDVLMYVLTKNA